MVLTHFGLESPISTFSGLAQGMQMIDKTNKL